MAAIKTRPQCSWQLTLSIERVGMFPPPPSLFLFHQVVWPCLAVIGGLDAGLCLGRLCQVEGDSEESVGSIVSTPDPEQKVIVQDQVTASTAQVKKRSAEISNHWSNTSGHRSL